MGFGPPSSDTRDRRSRKVASSVCSQNSQKNSQHIFTLLFNNISNLRVLISVQFPTAGFYIKRVGSKRPEVNCKALDKDLKHVCRAAGLV